MSLIQRLRRWLVKPALERRAALLNKIKLLPAFPFLFGRATWLSVFLSYHPDAYVQYHQHRDFQVIFERFIRHNRLNNAGDIARLWTFILNIKQVLSEGIKGDFAELGVWRGNTASVLAYFAAASGREVLLYDTFEGFDARDLTGVDSNKSRSFFNTSLDIVNDVLGPGISVCQIVKGFFPESIREADRSRGFAVVSVDCDLYEPMVAALEFFYPRMPKGGLLLIHDYSSVQWEGAKKAVDEFCSEKGEYPILIPDKSGTVIIRKSA